MYSLKCKICDVTMKIGRPQKPLDPNYGALCELCFIRFIELVDEVVPQFSSFYILSEYEKTLSQIHDKKKNDRSAKIKLGINAAKQKGIRLGRPPTISSDLKEQILAARKSGDTHARICARFNLSKGTVCRILKQGSV